MSSNNARHQCAATEHAHVAPHACRDGEVSRSDALDVAADIDAVERELCGFDVDEEMAEIIPMPARISPTLRSAIVRALEKTFEFGDAMDEWLHTSNPELRGQTPFERVVAGDGLGVLRALGVRANADRARSNQHKRKPTRTTDRRQPPAAREA